MRREQHVIEAEASRDHHRSMTASSRGHSKRGFDPLSGGSRSMDAPHDFDALENYLIRSQADLPKRLQQVAVFALEYPGEMALGTATSIATRVHVHASTLVRFAQTLGWPYLRRDRSKPDSASNG
jgi:hypothetical protein